MLGVVGLVGAKSWLDEQRAELRRAYYFEQAEFYREAGLASCLKRTAMEQTALARGWRFEESEKPVYCHAAPGAESYVRFLPDPPAPWVTKEDGWVAAFDGQGCRVEIVPTACD
ncbi:MAG: hypothetical protein ACRBCL_06520 [Maritimibacter sp.]